MRLSDRVRPDIDAAAWVCDEIKKLEAERDALKKDAERLDRLDIECESYGFEDAHEGNRWVIDGPFRTVRDAIDAALQGAQTVTEYEWNPPERLPPVGCPLVVLYFGNTLQVERTSHLQDKAGQMEYKLLGSDLTINGRLPWNYP